MLILVKLMQLQRVIFSFSSSFSQAEGKQKELVWSQSICGGSRRWPVKEDWEVQQYTQSQMEAGSHSVSTTDVLVVREDAVQQIDDFSWFVDYKSF